MDNDDLKTRGDVANILRENEILMDTFKMNRGICEGGILFLIFTAASQYLWLN